MCLHTERYDAFVGMNVAEFKNLIHSFMEIMSEDVCESIRASAGSMTMRFSKMLLGEVVSSDFAETNPETYAELISLAFGALTEKAYNRTPNATENYDLESRMLDIKSMDFRAMDCKVLYIRCPIILKQLNLNDEVNEQEKSLRTLKKPYLLPSPTRGILKIFSRSRAQSANATERSGV